MKTKVIIFFIVILSVEMSIAQEKKYLKFNEQGFTTIQIADGEREQANLDSIKSKYGTINEGVSFGLSLGFNHSLENIKTSQISPIDNTLLITNSQNTSFVLSTVISVPLFYKETGYRLLDKDGVEIGQFHKISDWSVIGIINLATFSEAENGSIFNQKISGGLGVAFNLNEYVSFGLSYELISYRKPKKFLTDLKGQEIQIDGTTLTSIDVADNNYFFDRYAKTISLKVIYKLTTK